MIIIETVIPVNYNNGEKIPSTIIDNCLYALAMEFGGYTLSGIGEGFWISDSRTYVEPIKVLKLAININDLEKAKAMIKAIGAELGQETMYFNIYDCKCEFIKV